MKKAKIVSLVLVLAFGMTGCGSERTVPANVPNTTTTTTTTVTASTTALSITATAGIETTESTVATTTAAKVSSVQRQPSSSPPVATVVNPSSATPVNNDGVKVSVEYVSQIGFPTGCESASAVMLLRFWGVNMDLGTFVDSYLDKGSIRYTSGGMVAPHPNDKFVGDPRRTAAYGCYAPVIVRALEKCLPSGMRVINETGTSLAGLCEQYLDNGMPVMVWATVDMRPVRVGNTWTVDSTGERFTWRAGEHCLLLVGYDESNYYLMDPYEGRGLVGYSRATVEARFAELGYQAVGVQKLPTTTTTTATTTTNTTTAKTVTVTMTAATTVSTTVAPAETTVIATMETSAFTEIAVTSATEAPPIVKEDDEG